ncbi:hypothetical protein HN51_002846 [Arachis hypogaea]|uniref:Uncharacterized protein LOC107466307 n=1 Tax=Arachis duranensis TaxID=130453 RepID=A0A6P4BE18_ARADU|nr:uncharacterized protein LOC107466307 [Arachis duranensis]XP_025613106.1 uncharacterized protein LOC112706161 [Arachis hypogaea]QHO51095.1 uncharacterized protein DS421_1g27960 [Arachis hypogaea]
MAGIVNLSPPTPILTFRNSSRHRNHLLTQTKPDSIFDHPALRYNGRFFCLFSDNRRQEQARKALEGALSGKKNELEKWDKEIKRREELGGGGDAGGGGWFGWGRYFGWSNDDNFWQEAKYASLTILGITLMYLLIAKGDLLVAVILNPLLYALRGVRNGLGFVTSKVLKNSSPSRQHDFGGFFKKEEYQQASAKENVVRKWASD